MYLIVFNSKIKIQFFLLKNLTHPNLIQWITNLLINYNDTIKDQY